MVDDVAERVEALLDREVELVVHGADVRGDLGRGGEVGCPFEPDRKGVQTRPPGVRLVVLFHAPGGILLRHCRDDR